MKIIIGVMGEGNGHAIREGIVIDHLKKKHKVEIFAHDKAYKYLSKRFSNVHEIESFNIAYRNNKSLFFGTIWMNLRKIHKIIGSCLYVRKFIKQYKPDVVISDFEPVTHYAALSVGKAAIGLNNQNDITLFNSKAGFFDIFHLINSLIIIFFFTVGSRKYLIFSLDPRKHTEKKKYMGNLIQEGIRKYKHKAGKHVFVYQTSQSNSLLLDILRQIDEKFLIYGFNKDEKDGNIIYRKFNNNRFYKDFCESKAVVTGGGLTVLTEAIHCKKPIISIPIKGQHEQIFNAKTIEEKGFGIYLKKIKKDRIENFFRDLDKYKKRLVKAKEMSHDEILEFIERKIKS